MDELSKLAYEGNLEVLKLKIRENNELATKLDEVIRKFSRFHMELCFQLLVRTFETYFLVRPSRISFRWCFVFYPPVL